MATLASVRADLLRLDAQLATEFPDAPQVRELRDEIQRWIERLDEEPTPNLEERFAQADRIHERLQHVIALLEEWDR